MKQLYSQSGIGLVEVLVSLLLLAVAILGFTTLQMNSVKATDESLKRTQAMSVVRGLSEDIRANISATETFRLVIKENQDKTDIDSLSINVVKKVNENSSDDITKSININSCQTFETEPCTDVHVAARDALQALAEAEELEIKLGLELCPGTQVDAGTASTNSADVSDIEQHCIITAWNDTKPIFDGSDKLACGDDNGIYKTNANCIIVGAY